MRKPPAWKIRRELARLGEQVLSLPALFYEPVLKWHHDRHRVDRLRISGATTPPGPRLALLLIYQPKGLPASILATCRHLRDCGYAVFAVSNGALSPQDHARLQAEVWRIMERPNFGYDFGGYRDGLLQIAEWGLRPDHLIVMNDSIWFPVGESAGLIARTEDDLSIVGFLMHTRASRELAGDPEPPGMIESYFFNIPRTILDHPAFLAFWTRFCPSNSKGRTIFRGERGFSKAMRAAGVPLQALSSRKQFLQAIRPTDAEFLRRTLHYAAYSDAELEAAGRAVLDAWEPTPHWVELALRHIETTVLRRRFNASFYWAADRLGLTAFMKKNDAMLFARMRRQALAAIDAGDLPAPPPPILQEIREWNGPGPLADELRGPP